MNHTYVHQFIHTYDRPFICMMIDMRVNPNDSICTSHSGRGLTKYSCVVVSF